MYNQTIRLILQQFSTISYKFEVNILIILINVFMFSASATYIPTDKREVQVPFQLELNNLKKIR